MIRAFLFAISALIPISSWSQNTCLVNNLWQNGDFESSDLTCLVFNPTNAYSNNNAPWYGFTVFRWQPTYELQPSYLSEADYDHTLGTNSGHYLYIDPRAKSGWNYEFKQDIQVEKNKTYTFSMWYCSMNLGNNPKATIRLTVNGSVVAAQVTIPNANNQWVKISGTWNSGTNTKATAALEGANPGVSGHDYAIDDISFGPGKLVAFAGKDTTLCASNAYQLGLLNAAQYGVSCDNKYTYAWQPASNFSSSNTISSPVLKTPIIPGIYTLSVVDYAGNVCKDTVNINVASNVSKPLDVFKDTALCGPISFNIKLPAKYKVIAWENGDTTYQRSFTNAGKFWLTFKDICANFYDTFQITQKPDIPAFNLNDSLVCPNSAVTRSLSNIAYAKSIQWNDADTNRTKLFNSPGLYWVIAKNDCGSKSDSFTITNINETGPSLGADIILCENEDTTLFIPYSFTKIIWSDLDTAHFKRLNQAGKIKLFFQGQCQNFADSLNVSIVQPIAFSLGEDDTICFFAPISLTAPGGNTYLWSNGSTVQTLEVTGPGTYAVKITSPQGCQSQDEIILFAETGSEQIDVPNAFTPDGNGLNDLFPLNSLPVTARLQIFNRWGEAIYDSETNPLWDGNYRGKQAQEGVYAYILTYHDCQNYPIVKKGSVHILR